MIKLKINSEISGRGLPKYYKKTGISSHTRRLLYAAFEKYLNKGVPELILYLEKIGMKMPYNNIIRLKIPYSFANKVPSDRDTKTIHYTGYYIKNVGEGKEVISKSEEHEKMIVLC